MINMVRNVESRTITVNIDDWCEFGKICEANGMDRSKKIRQWIKKFNDLAKKGKININV